jgi:hypothetical protein
MFERHRNRNVSTASSQIAGQITGRLRGEALYKARGSCSNCGRSIEEHDVVLVVVWKVPREFGGLIEHNSPWAICEECNVAKKEYFDSGGAAWIRDLMKLKSVHVRLGETLIAFKGEPVPDQIMDIVGHQDDWKKRVRELRYLGWEIDVFSPKLPNGRVSSFYKLVKSAPWPDDPTRVIRRYEQERAERNRKR